MNGVKFQNSVYMFCVANYALPNKIIRMEIGQEMKEKKHIL